MPPSSRCHGQGGRGLPLSKIRGQKEKAIDEPPSSMSQIRDPRGRGHCLARPTANGGRPMPQQATARLNLPFRPNAAPAVTTVVALAESGGMQNSFRVCPQLPLCMHSYQIRKLVDLRSQPVQRVFSRRRNLGARAHPRRLARRRGELLSSLNMVDRGCFRKNHVIHTCS